MLLSNGKNGSMALSLSFVSRNYRCVTLFVSIGRYNQGSLLNGQSRLRIQLDYTDEETERYQVGSIKSSNWRKISVSFKRNHLKKVRISIFSVIRGFYKECNFNGTFFNDHQHAGFSCDTYDISPR